MSWFPSSTCGISFPWLIYNSRLGSQPFGTRLIQTNLCNLLRICKPSKLIHKTLKTKKLRIGKHSMLLMIELRTWTPSSHWSHNSTLSLCKRDIGRSSWRLLASPLTSTHQTSVLKIWLSSNFTTTQKRLLNLSTVLKRKLKSRLTLPRLKESGKNRNLSSEITKILKFLELWMKL